MFVDYVKIYVKAGNGGDGAVSFLREKYVPNGGPDGGDGGIGGDIIFLPDSTLSTLADFKYKRKYKAENGQNGAKRRRSGKKGQHLLIKVPLGTVVKIADSNEILADISEHKEYVIARGGRGGYGNMHFANSIRQAPRFSKPGTPGEELELILELKLLADVGLIGLPNVGKSSLISFVSAAKPAVANYHFTTITPVLGVVTQPSGNSFVMADIPGLIEGAFEGSGLGHQFLRHIERCRLLVHVVDISGSEGRDPIKDFDVINKELVKFNAELSNLPMIVAGNKCDLADDNQINKFKKYVEDKGYEFFSIIAPIGEGTKALLNRVEAKLQTLPPVKIYQVEEKADSTRQNLMDRFDFDIVKQNNFYVVESKYLSGVLRTIDLRDHESLQYLHNVLGKIGVMGKLRKMNINEGDTVVIDDYQFEFWE